MNAFIDLPVHVQDCGNIGFMSRSSLPWRHGLETAPVLANKFFGGESCCWALLLLICLLPTLGGL